MQSRDLPELRELRDQIEQCRKLMKRRDALIRKSAAKYPQRRIAQAAGVSQSRVNQLIAKN